MTLRAQYSPDQYADSIVKPIVDDQHGEARMHYYNFKISEWMSEKDSPLTPLLETCEEPRLERRAAGLKKILHAASKLSLQLWVQDSEVVVIDDMHSQGNLLRLFDHRVASLHSLMSESADPVQLRGQEVDLLIRPRIQMTKFDLAHPDRQRSINTKASVMICSDEDRVTNKEEHENRNKPRESPNTSQNQTEQVLLDQDSTGAAKGVSGENIGSTQITSETSTRGVCKETRQLSPEKTDAASSINQKVCKILQCLFFQKAELV